MVTRPDAPPGRGRTAGRRRPVAERGRASSAYRCSSREHPRDPDFQDGAARAATRTAARSSPTARCCRSRRSTSRAHGWVNLHFSLLPAWRGAAPVQHAIWAGDEVTGATTFRIVQELDAGPTYGVMTETIRPARHRRRPARPARRGRRRAAGRDPRRHRGRHRSRRGRSPPTASRSPPRSPSTTPGSTGPQPAVAVDRRVRACTPAPGAWTTYAGERVKLGPVHAGRRRRCRPGELVAGKNAVVVGTGTAAVRLGEVQAVGKRPMAAADWARGAAARAGGRGVSGMSREGRGSPTSTRSAARCPRSSSARRGATGRRTSSARSPSRAASCSPARRGTTRSTRRPARSTTTCW